ncbi:NAD-dependent epimerase/dehydratase family protein [Planktomarina temperata]|nr:NAD-dependent epimerase/dehydratase family protein [bacterium]MDB2458905.1 NAD-dependent epimerase/dehydratase family protein [Planktomarina temperata]
MNITVIGCNGFIGSALLDYLGDDAKLNVVGVCRDATYKSKRGIKIVYTSNLNALNDQSDILRSTDVVIYAAGKAHASSRKACVSQKDYFHVNTDMTLQLARQAANAGVKRFIFLSSTKVFGEPKQPFHSFNHKSATYPEDPYGASKLKAEIGLMALSNAVGLEVVIIRPPLVYGAQVKGNMSMLSKLVQSNLPLPFGSITSNRRSIVSIDNLVDLIYNCITNTSASGQTFLVSDDRDLSTFDIVSLLKKCSKSRSIVFKSPILLLYFFGYATGSIGVVRRLVESSVVDIEHTKTVLNWSPPQSVENAFEKMVG